MGNKQRICEFAPLFNEFNVLGLTLTPGEEETHAKIEGPSLLVAVRRT